MNTATIGGESVTIADFSAYKALKAMEIVGAIEDDIRALMDDAAEFRRDYGEKNTLVLSRAEARRQFRPQPLMRHSANEETGEVTVEPVLKDGEPVAGPDPLAHLTDADWEASGNELRIPEQPSDDVVMGNLILSAFKRARVSVLRLLALAVVPNSDLERWDGEADLDAELDKEAKRLVHRAMAEELIGLAVAVMRACQEQLAAPFREALEAGRDLFAPQKTENEEEVVAPEQGPMRVVQEADSTAGPQTSSTDSPADTAGDQTGSSIEPGSASSSL